MDLETENRIAAMLLKEAAELRRQAEKEGVEVYLRQPKPRGRPNSRFLTATVLGVQQGQYFMYLVFEILVYANILDNLETFMHRIIYYISFNYISITIVILLKTRSSTVNCFILSWILVFLTVIIFDI